MATKDASVRSLWTVDAKEYSKGKFYTAATDDKGHASKLNVSLPPQITTQIAEMVASRRFPYRTTSELIRDAVVHRLHDLTDAGILALSPEERDSLDEWVRSEARQQFRTQYDAEIEQMTSEAAALRDTLQRAFMARDYDTLRLFIGRMGEQYANAREPFRSQVMSLFAHYRAQLPPET